MSDIKKRAERNGKIRRTESQIQQTIAKLERMKTEYIQSANEAKARGEMASYRLAKSGINATITQIRRAKEMLLNIQITAELQKMGDNNADFLGTMSMIAKRISKINKKSDFVKLQKEIDVALSGVEQAQAGLDGFLKNTDAAFAAISQTTGALDDEQLEALINGNVTEHDLMMDDSIRELQQKLDAQKNQGQERVGVHEGASDSKETDQNEENSADDNDTDEPAVAKPFPSPSGAFDFKPGKAKTVPSGVKNLAGEVTLGHIVKPAVNIQSVNGAVEQLEFSQFSHILIAGDPNSLCERALCALAVELSAAKVRFVIADFGSGRLCDYDGMTHLAANSIVEADEFAPMLAELKAEAERRYDLFGAANASDIDEYLENGNKLPYIVLFINGITGAFTDKRVENDFLRFVRGSGAAGIYSIVCTCDALSSLPISVRSAYTCVEFGGDEFTLGGVNYREPEFDERMKAAIIAAQSGGVL